MDNCSLGAQILYCYRKSTQAQKTMFPILELLQKCCTKSFKDWQYTNGTSKVNRNKHNFEKLEIGLMNNCAKREIDKSKITCLILQN